MSRLLIVLAVLLGRAGAVAPPGEFSITTVQDLKGPGPTTDKFGWCLATGEIDGDGFMDIAVGAPGDTELGPESGAVYVYSGRTFELMHVLRPEGASERFGVAVAFADVDRDGQADLIAGASGWSQGRGAIYACVKLRKDEPPQPVRIYEGERPYDHLGWAVSPAPARPGMELEGVLVGAPGHDEAGKDDAGQALQLRFKGNKLKAEVVQSWSGSTLGAELGNCVELGGDQDDDGTWDLLVGEPGAGEGKKGAGALRILDGADGSLLHEYKGSADGDRFGASANYVRVHGEGVQYHEVVVGAPGGGYVSVFSSREGAERQRLKGRPGETGFGTQVTRSARLGSEYQYAFAVMSPTGPGGKKPQDFRGVRVYSGENFAVLAQIPMPDVRSVHAVELDAEIGEELLLGEVKADGGVVHVVRVRYED